MSTTGAASGVGGAAPMELEQLQAQGTGQTPAPVALSELAGLAASSGQAATEGGAPPPPLPIEQLQTAGVGGAPTPTDLGAFGQETGTPRPMSMEELEGLGGGEAERRDEDNGPRPETPRSKRG